jgi:hypothetical protein
MATGNSTLTATLKANTRDFDAGMKRANSSLSSLRRSVSSLKNVAITIGVTVAARAAVRTLKDSVMLAVNLGETINKANVLFGESYQSIVKWSQTTNASLAMTQQQLLDIAAGFKGSLFARGITDLGKATWLTDLSADLASFYNTTADAAAQALSGALRGEYDMLERYNIFINESALKTEARRMGILDTNRALTDQEKTLASISIIERQSVDAQGDLARTMNSTANQLRQLQVNWATLKTTIGKVFQPLLDYWLPGINNYLKGLFDPEQLEERIANWARVVMDWNLMIRDAFVKTRDAVVEFFDTLRDPENTKSVAALLGEGTYKITGSQELATTVGEFATAVTLLGTHVTAMASAWSKQPEWVKAVELFTVSLIGPAGLPLVSQTFAGVMRASLGELGALFAALPGGINRAVGSVFAAFSERGSVPANPLYVWTVNGGPGGGDTPNLGKKVGTWLTGLFAGGWTAAKFAGSATLSAAPALAGLAGVLLAPIAAAVAGLEVWKRVDPESYNQALKNQGKMAEKIAEGNVTSTGNSHYLTNKLQPKIDSIEKNLRQQVPVQPAVPGGAWTGIPSNGSSYPTMPRSAVPNVYIDGKQVATQVTPAVVRNMTRSASPVVYSPFLAGGAA